MSALAGVKGVLFDCYDTLIEIAVDEESERTCTEVAGWLHYHGVRIDPDTLRREYRARIAREMDRSGERYPEVRLEEIFAGICHDHRIWEIDEVSLGILAARTFRAASLRLLRVIPRSVTLLDFLGDLPKGVVSNGQRVFSAVELRYFGLSGYFAVVVFSSDLGIKKPDPRIFRYALDRLGLAPEEVLFVGNSREEDIIPARKLGMQTLYADEAWELPYT